MRLIALAAALATAIGAATAIAQDQTEPPEGDAVAAIVNGEPILMSDVEQAYLSEPQLRQVPMEAVYAPLLQHLVSVRLVAAAARDAGLEEDPGVQAQIAAATDEIMQRAYLTRRVEEQITEERLTEAYESFAADNPDMEQVHARHILVDTQDDARALIEELRNGADFAALAREHSTGPSGENGGDLGYFGRSSMVPAFAEAAFSMEPGEISSAPVETQFGWHVIKVEDRRSAPPMAEVEGDLRQQLAQDLIGEIVGTLRDGADVQYFDQQGQPMDPPPPPQ